MEIKYIITSKDSKYYSGRKEGNQFNDNAECIFHQEAECHAGKGLLGDRFYNYKENFKGQVTFISYELHEELQKAFKKEVPLQEYRRNIFVTGRDPLELVGKRFKIGEVEFEGTENCTPCKFMDKFVAKGAWDWMNEHNSGGLRARVLTNGILRVGDLLNHESHS